MEFISVYIQISEYSDPNVPPRNVLKKMFPTKTFDPACLFPVSLATYNQWVTEQMKEYNLRQMNLKSIEIERSRFPDLNDTQNENNDKDGLFLDPNDFCYRLKLEDTYFGIEPKKANTTRRCVYDFSLCDCKNQHQPSYLFKKQIKLKENFGPKLVNPNSFEFKSFQNMIEKKVIYTYP